MSFWANSWGGFLPKRALVMGKRAQVDCQTSDESPRLAVVGEGNPQAELFFISEAAYDPTETQLLDRMIAAMGVSRQQVYVGHLVAANTPSCESLNAAKMIVTLGEPAAQTLLQSQTSLSELRGQFHAYRGAKLLPTFHPSDLLLHPELKKETWNDLQSVARELGIQIPKK